MCRLLPRCTTSTSARGWHVATAFARRSYCLPDRAARKRIKTRVSGRGGRGSGAGPANPHPEMDATTRPQHAGVVSLKCGAYVIRYAGSVTESTTTLFLTITSTLVHPVWAITLCLWSRVTATAVTALQPCTAGHGLGFRVFVCMCVWHINLGLLLLAP